MALTGIQIFKLLPKTNCKECGVPTCLAFAMNLASGVGSIGTADSSGGHRQRGQGRHHRR
jgi:ArsR family metal-binding transcriptional regulator